MEKLKMILEKDVPRLRKTMAKRGDESLQPDYDRFRLSQMLIGTITEFEEVVRCMEKTTHFVMYIGNTDNAIAKETAKMLREELLLEVGDMYWYIINSFEFLNLSSPLAAIETALEMVEDITVPEYEELRMRTLDKTKKYLFQQHDLERYMKDFSYFIAATIRVTKIILENTHEIFFGEFGLTENYDIADVITMVADKLEKRYKGKEFDAKESMDRSDE